MGWTLEALGEDAVLLRLGDAISADVNRRVHALAARIGQARAPWLREIVPAYASLALFVDTGHVQVRDAEPLALIGDWLRAHVGDTEAEAAMDVDVVDADASDAIVEIPVCYETDCAPDLDSVAAHAGIDATDVIARHSDRTYTVGMIGFAPGFPYLIGLDPVLSMARRATPRLRVPAGSVAIGGTQTGIYPRQGPGGWQLIGRTPWRLFDPTRVRPSLLRPGQRVRFRPVSADAYAQLAATASGDLPGRRT